MCLAIVVARRLRSLEVLETLAELFVTHGVPAHIRAACYDQVVCEHDLPACRGQSVTPVGVGEWWPDP